MAAIKKYLRNKVWVRIVSRLDPDGECLVWTGTRTKGGYGQLFLKERGGLLYLHRLVFSLLNGPIPEGMVVMHTCDNRACANPAHLRLATQKDNLRDMAKKGRAAFARLTPEAVLRIREDGRSHTQVARAFGVHRDTIRLIRGRKTWVEL